jgi:Heparinase II/III-like protein.
MNNTEKLAAVIDSCYGDIKKYGSLKEYFKNRTAPSYLFSLSDAEKMKDKEILSDAEKVMNHDVFGYKFSGDIDYLFNPTAETSRDNEWSWSLFRTIYWQSLARAYALTKDEKYTKEFLAQMHGFVKAWPAEKYIEDMTFEVKTPFPGHAWRTIETGIRIYTTWLPCFEIFRHSDVWSEDDLATFLLGVRNHALFLMGHYSNHDRSSNWLSMEASALYQIGIMFPEFKEAEEWKNTGYQRIMHEVRYCFSDNGIHMEKTPIYHLVAAIAFEQAIVLSKKNGITVAPYAQEILTRAGKYVASLFKPDLSTPMIGDADRDDLTTRKADTSIYEGMNLSFFPEDMNELRAYFKWMYEITGDEEFNYFATLRKEGKAPSKLDYDYREEGIYVVRSGWESDDDYLLMHSTQLERGERSTHSHNDSLHAEVTLKGDDILIDSGRYIYRSSIWRDWREYFTSALAHNTLFVDNHEMGTVPNVTRVRGVRALCHDFGAKADGVKVIDLSHNGYAFIPDSVFHRRKAVLLPSSAVVLVDYVTGLGKEDHDFRLMFNFNKGDVVLSGSDALYKAVNGHEYKLSFIATKELTPTLLYGSEDPKGGWVSYGYPVREPIGQVAYSFIGKAPFQAVSIISEKGHDIKAEIKGDEVIVLDGKVKYSITEEGVKTL